MEEVRNFSDYKVDKNQVFVNGDESSIDNKSKITFLGVNNIIYIEDGVKIVDSNIVFNGNNSVIYLRHSRHLYKVSIGVYNNSVVFMGKNNFINPASRLQILASEHQNIILGSNNLISFGVLVRTADAHLLYDSKTKMRINPSKSVLIGDHTWLGQDSLILKGSQIGSGSIVGANSVVSGKKIKSNTVNAGNPIRFIRDEAFFSTECVHDWTNERTEEYEQMDANSWIYEENDTTINFDDLDIKLKSSAKAEDKLESIKNILADGEKKNRFYIGKIC